MGKILPRGAQWGIVSESLPSTPYRFIGQHLIYDCTTGKRDVLGNHRPPPPPPETPPPREGLSSMVVRFASYHRSCLGGEKRQVAG